MARRQEGLGLLSAAPRTHLLVGATGSLEVLGGLVPSGLLLVLRSATVSCGCVPGSHGRTGLAALHRTNRPQSPARVGRRGHHGRRPQVFFGRIHQYESVSVLVPKARCRRKIETTRPQWWRQLAWCGRALSRESWLTERYCLSGEGGRMCFPDENLWAAVGPSSDIRRRGEAMATLLSVNVGMPTGRVVARPDRAHRESGRARSPGRGWCAG